MEGAGRDEEDVVRLDRPILGHHGGPLDDRQQPPLDPFAADIRPADGALPPGDLVHLIDEDHPGLLGPVDRLQGDLLRLDHALGLLVEQDASSFGNGEVPAPALLGEHAPQHVLEVHPHLLHAALGEDGEGEEPVLLDLDLDHLLVELASEQPASQLRPVGVVGGRLLLLHGLRRALLEDRRHRVAQALDPLGRTAGAPPLKRIEQALDGAVLGPPPDRFHLLRAHHAHGGLDQVANHRVHVAADIPDLRVLARLHLDERGADETGQPARDLSLPHPRGADHEDVLRDDLVPDIVGELLAPHAVAQRDGHRSLGGRLADDVLVQLRHDPARSEVVQFIPGCGIGAYAHGSKIVSQSERPTKQPGLRRVIPGP